MINEQSRKNHTLEEKKISVIERDRVSKWERIKINTNHFSIILYGVGFSLFASLFSSEIKKEKERRFHRISRAFGRGERPGIMFRGRNHYHVAPLR